MWQSVVILISILTMGFLKGFSLQHIKKISHSTLNGGMLQIDTVFPGENEWEELKKISKKEKKFAQ